MAISLANALCSSNTLKELHIVGINTITIAGRWHLSAGHFQKALWNTTLSDDYGEAFWEGTDSLLSLLRINK